MNLIDFLKIAKIESLCLSPSITKKLEEQNLTEFTKIYAAVQTFKVFGKCSVNGLTDEEMETLDQSVIGLMVANGLMKSKVSSIQSTPMKKPLRPVPSNRLTAENSKQQSKPSISVYPNTIENAVPHVKPVEPPTVSSGRSVVQPHPLFIWEAKLAPQIRNVELIGEISVSKQELDEITAHISRLLSNTREEAAMETIEKNFPVTFLIFMVGQGIYGYNNGELWQSYKNVLHKDIDCGSFGKLFHKILSRFGKTQFPELQERSMKYVSTILAHGGIPAYCLKDFFNNIVLNSSVRQQLLALDGEELVGELLSHSSYTANTDKPVLYFLEYGDKTASDLLDRSRKMLLAWQHSQTLMSPNDAGLPSHIVDYFSQWIRETPVSAVDRGSRSKLKRPQIALDPWGLGIFLILPSEPVSAFVGNDHFWKVEFGNSSENIKARTRRKGDQVETREITLRLNELAENIQVQFSTNNNTFDWKIAGYSSENLILAFDPMNGHLQNRVIGREIWLLFPEQYSISVIEGEGNLMEILPTLPGEWSKFKLECWDLSQARLIGINRNDHLVREVIVRSQDKVLEPSLEGGRVISTDLDEDPIPVYIGTPPRICIPLSRSDDLNSELGRWKIHFENIGVADPEVNFDATLVKLGDDTCSIVNNSALVSLSASQFLKSKPVGTYLISIKGPLGRDAELSFHIVPELIVTGLKELYVPDRINGPEPAMFAIQAALLDNIVSLNGADGIKIRSGASGLHDIQVPSHVGTVGLLIRREIINHLYVQIPIHFRIKQLRWRLVDDKVIVDNWQQKHSTISLQELEQQESPFLIVDLPGNESGELALELNLFDIQGNCVQRIEPADRSSKRVNQFWRFDISKIRFLMGVSDSPIYRLDLICANRSKDRESFSLPVLVFTRELQVKSIQTEVYASSDKYHVLVTWQEKRQLRSRALVLWSIFSPWQSPIIEQIPDSACGEYELVILRKDHAIGTYRMQMIVVDPWAPILISPFPPPVETNGCHDLELSSPVERLKNLEQEVSTAKFHQSPKLNNLIELALIRQYMGDQEESCLDLVKCCHNLSAATTWEIITLRSILKQYQSASLDQAFGTQISHPDVLQRLSQDMLVGVILLSDFMFILNLLPNSKTWSAPACEILVQVEEPKIRFRALVQLVLLDIANAVVWIVKLLEQSVLSLDDAVQLMYEEKPLAIQQLKKMGDNPTANRLLAMFSLYNPFSGLPMVQTGSWVQTNAGWGRIEEIMHPRSRISVDNFLEGSGKYLLSVTLNIYESNDCTGEKSLINMETDKIIFPGATKIYSCRHCQELVTTDLGILKKHLGEKHEKSLIDFPGERANSVPLVFIKFYKNPQTTQRDI